MSSSFTWNSVDFGGASYKLFITSSVFPLLGKPRVNLMELATEDGCVSQGSSLGELYFRFNCVIDADSETERETCIWNVIEALAETKEGEAALVFDHWPTRQWMARLYDGIDGELAITGAEFQLCFVAANPTATIIG
jgi:hypothetical protein